MKVIGILALQGAFAEHRKLLEQMDVQTCEIRQKSDLLRQSLDGLILPGGESTVIGKLLRELDMLELLQRRIKEGLPVLGTCAGLILLAKHIVNDSNSYLRTMDIGVMRNAYGRQLGSFRTIEEFLGVGSVPMTFIRAPYIVEAGDKVQVLAQVDEKIVAARENNMLVTAFHPELTEDPRIHQYFLTMT
jgi:5'-phosphate synthase pdxT subunit